MAERENGFLSRWSRRKQEAQETRERPKDELEGRSDPPASPAPGTELEADAEARGAAAPGEGQAGAAEPIPDIDSLTLESDFRRFLKPDVPAALRNQALRKLWRLDPVFANLDGLNDYDEDYSQIGKSPVATLRSLYRVGRGMISGNEAAAEAAEAAKAAGTEAAGAEAGAELPGVPEGAGEAGSPEAAPSGEEPARIGSREADDSAPATGPKPQEERPEPALQPESQVVRQAVAPPAPAPEGPPAAARRRWGGFAGGDDESA